MIAVGDKQMMPRSGAAFQGTDEGINHDLTDGVRRPQLPRDRTHWPVTVAAHRRLHDGEFQRNRSNMQQVD